MMIKKTLKTLLVFLCLQVILFSCCKDEEFITLRNFFLELYDTSNDDEVTVTSENFRLYLRPSFQVVSKSWKKELIPNSVYAAIDCDPEKVIRNKVTSITITSNIEIAGITAGEPINDLLVYQEFLDVIGFFEMSTFVSTINNPASDDFYFSFINPEVISTESSATFTVVITLTDETQIIQTSEVVTFE